MKELKYWLVFTSLSLALVGCGRKAGPGSARKPAAAAAATAEAPQPTAPTARSLLEHATAPQLLGQIKSSGHPATLVNAWASWCGPCRREVPMLQALASNLKPQGVQIVFVSVDEPHDEAKARSFLEDNHITLPSYLVEGSVADFKEGINPNWPGMLPASFLFDSRGLLVHFWGGEAFEGEIVPVIDGFLSGKPIEAETRYGLAPGKVEP